MNTMLKISVFCFAAVIASSFAFFSFSELLKVFMCAAIIVLLER